MIERLLLLESGTTDPYRNLAVEAALLTGAAPGVCVLYLWQNEKTVVIGRNQNVYAECDLAALAADGGHLARRLSGGGAVYHDLGNLNFTFVARREDFDKARQTDIILRAVRLAGVDAVKNGRNDLTAGGRKFSGSAYYRTKEGCCHHGTLMLSVDTERLTAYLRVSAEKLRGRGVASVRSRVMNLRDEAPALTVPEMKRCLAEAFGAEYGLSVVRLDEAELDAGAIAASEARFRSRVWLYGDACPLPHTTERRFDTGLLRLDYEVSTAPDGGKVFWRAIVSTDALETDFDARLGERLCGVPVSPDAVLARLTAGRGTLSETERITAEQIAALVGGISEGE